MPEKRELSRLEQMRIDHIDPKLPECAADHLAGYLWEIGPTETGGMGPAPLSHGEIAAWQGNTGVDLNSWEARTLRRLSIEYLNEAERAKKPACPPPWAPKPETGAKEILARKIRSALRG